MDAKEQKMISNQINDKMKEMVDDDEDLEAADVICILLRTYSKSWKLKWPRIRRKISLRSKLE